MIKVIPAIDLINGEVVRLKQGDYAEKTVYERDPLVYAEKLDKHGVRNLHLVDLDAAKYGDLRNILLLERLVERFNFSIDYGGGVKSLERAKKVLAAGAEKVNIGSLIVKDYEAFKKIAANLGDKIIASLDVKGEEIAVDAWQTGSGQSLFEWVPRIKELGIRSFCCTDISRDGMLNGPSIDLYREILKEHPDIELIASGGVGSLEDVRALEQIGCDAVIVGKALLEGKIPMDKIC